MRPEIMRAMKTGETAGLTYPERIEVRVRSWTQWSRAERSDGLAAVLEEILEHCRAGTGNAFIRRWCEFNLASV